MNKICLAAATAAAAFLLSACSTGSKYYQHDGPPSSSAELDTSSATPRVEHFYPASLRPYTVMGQRYVPVTSDVKMDQTGIASWYGHRRNVQHARHVGRPSHDAATELRPHHQP